MVEYDPAILRLSRMLCRSAEYDQTRRGRVTMPELCAEVEKTLGLV